MTKLELMANIYCAMLVKGDIPEEMNADDLGHELESRADRFTAAVNAITHLDSPHEPLRIKG